MVDIVLSRALVVLQFLKSSIIAHTAVFVVLLIFTLVFFGKKIKYYRWSRDYELNRKRVKSGFWDKLADKIDDWSGDSYYRFAKRHNYEVDQAIKSETWRKKQITATVLCVLTVCVLIWVYCLVTLRNLVVKDTSPLNFLTVLLYPFKLLFFNVFHLGGK